MSLPWSDKGQKTDPGVAADQIMLLDSEDGNPATKNKRMDYQNLADTLSNLSSAHAEIRLTNTLEQSMAQNVRFQLVDLNPDPNEWTNDPATKNFTVDVELGIITYNGPDKTFFIQYSFKAVPVTGGAQTQILDLGINTIQQVKSIVTITTNPSGGNPVEGQYIGGLFTLSPGDELRLFSENTSNAQDTFFTDTTILITGA